MARKNLLAGLTNAELPTGNSVVDGPPRSDPKLTTPPHLGAMGTRGAIGAVTRSIEQLKSQSIVEIDPALVDGSFVSDRLPGSDTDYAALVALIREHGQQVPILARPHPERPGRYQIAYGHRRLKAVAELGRRVRAVVKQLTDAQLVVAQGQENSARTDLSFVERALFAANLEDRGFDRETIMAALSVDKTGLSRLITAAVKVPRDIIEGIGAAPKAGRDRWLELAERFERKGASEAARARISQAGFADLPSDERFNKLFEELSARKMRSVRPTVWKTETGKSIGRIKEDERSLTLVVDKKAHAEFAAYFVAQLPEIYAAFNRRGEE
jgi:ParB family transcriptional regulator, chromosome partitioning protein